VSATLTQTIGGPLMQTRADALADAETLAANVWMREVWHTTDAWLLAAEVRNVRDGWRVSDLQAYMNRAVHTPYESNVSLYLLEVKRIAGALARAAFRAVPSLRDAR
jgi:hypothetical protein